jgi:predicted amidohydrolase YtcJ
LFFLSQVNSKVLHNLGIGKDTPDPEGGTIDRDDQGEPTGILREAAADIVRKRVLANKERRKQYIVKGLHYCLKKGITTVQTNDENAWESTN